jgi:hypothetical protein
MKYDENGFEDDGDERFDRMRDDAITDELDERRRMEEEGGEQGEQEEAERKAHAFLNGEMGPITEQERRAICRFLGLDRMEEIGAYSKRVEQRFAADRARRAAQRDRAVRGRSGSTAIR